MSKKRHRAKKRPPPKSKPPEFPPAQNKLRLSKKEMLLGGIGTAVSLASLRANDPYILIPLLAFSSLCFSLLCWLHEGSKLARTLTAFFISMVLALVGLRILSTPNIDIETTRQGIQQPQSGGESSKPAEPKKPLTIASLFEDDFPEFYRIRGDVEHVTSKHRLKTPLQSKLYLDFGANSQFVGFYIPQGPYTYQDSEERAPASSYEWALSLSSGAKSPLALAKTFSKAEAGFMDERTSISDLTFTGRVYIYYEDQFSPRQVADLTDRFKKNGYSLILRGLDYLRNKVLVS
jgi:hypothetical protein